MSANHVLYSSKGSLFNYCYPDFGEKRKLWKVNRGTWLKDKGAWRFKGKALPLDEIDDNTGERLISSEVFEIVSHKGESAFVV